MPNPLASFAVSAAMGVAGGIVDRISNAVDGAQTKARKAAEDFETMYLEQMLERMFATLGDEGPLGEAGPGADVYRSMMVKEYAGAIAKSGGVGLSDQVYGEILKLQEGAGHVG